MALDLIRIAKRPPENVFGWMTFLHRALKSRRLSQFFSEDFTVLTAARISLFGAPGDPLGTEVFQAFVQLFFHHERIKQWEAALAKIPPVREDILHITRSVQACNVILEPMERAKFPFLPFIKVALSLPDPKVYVEICKRESSDRLIRSAFHPNTLNYIAARYRGVVGDLASVDYRSMVDATVKTIS